MKKVLALVLTLVLVLSLAACGGGSSSNSGGEKSKETTESATTMVSLGETVSTDIVDFTLKDAQFSNYASTTNATFGEPLSNDKAGALKAAKGRVLVILTFEIKNNDRTTLEVGGGDFSDWKFDFTLTYKGQEYPIKGYDHNDKDGDISGMHLCNSGVSTDGTNWVEHKKGTESMISGKRMIFRVVTVAVVEPDSLNDPFNVTVNIPSSSETEYYTYDTATK